MNGSGDVCSSVDPFDAITNGDSPSRSRAYFRVKFSKLTNIFNITNGSIEEADEEFFATRRVKFEKIIFVPPFIRGSNFRAVYCRRYDRCTET